MSDVLDEKWAAYFAPFTLTAETNETILRGMAHDQAELFGTLLKIRDLGLTDEALDSTAGLCSEPKSWAGWQRFIQFE